MPRASAKSADNSGTRCRTQIEQADTGRIPVHLAEVLAAGLRDQAVQSSRPAPADCW